MENPYKSKQVDGAYGEILFNRYLRAWFDTFYDINNIFKVAQRLEHHGSTLKTINFRTYPNLGTGEERNKLPYMLEYKSRNFGQNLTNIFSIQLKRGVIK